jgi:hypothetical protein
MSYEVTNWDNSENGLSSSKMLAMPQNLGLCQISSAVSTVLRVKRFPFGWTMMRSSVEYGDLR